MWLSLCNHTAVELFISHTSCPVNPACSCPTALPACPCGAQRGLSRMNPPRQVLPTSHLHSTHRKHWTGTGTPALHTLFLAFFVQRPCVNTSLNQLFQDRCASLASEQCNYFPSSPLSKSRGFIGLLMVWFVVGRNKKDSNSLIILSYRYPAE